MDKVIRSFIVLFVLLIAITGYHKSYDQSYDQSYNASTINNLKENIFFAVRIWWWTSSLWRNSHLW